MKMNSLSCLLVSWKKSPFPSPASQEGAPWTPSPKSKLVRVFLEHGRHRRIRQTKRTAMRTFRETLEAVSVHRYECMRRFTFYEMGARLLTGQIASQGSLLSPHQTATRRTEHWALSMTGSLLSLMPMVSCESSAFFRVGHILTESHSGCLILFAPLVSMIRLVNHVIFLSLGESSEASKPVSETVALRACVFCTTSISFDH